MYYGGKHMALSQLIEHTTFRAQSFNHVTRDLIILLSILDERIPNGAIEHPWAPALIRVTPNGDWYILEGPFSPIESVLWWKSTDAPRRTLSNSAQRLRSNTETSTAPVFPKISQIPHLNDNQLSLMLSSVILSHLDTILAMTSRDFENATSDLADSYEQLQIEPHNDNQLSLDRFIQDKLDSMIENFKSKKELCTKLFDGLGFADRTIPDLDAEIKYINGLEAIDAQNTLASSIDRLFRLWMIVGHRSHSPSAASQWFVNRVPGSHIEKLLGHEQLNVANNFLEHGFVKDAGIALIDPILVARSTIKLNGGFGSNDESEAINTKAKSIAARLMRFYDALILADRGDEAFQMLVFAIARCNEIKNGRSISEILQAELSSRNERM